MNSDREIILEETLQQALTQMKNRTWTDIESLSSSGNIPVDKVFDKASQDLAHVKMLHSMLSTMKPISTERADPKKCEDSVEFRRIAQYFQTNTDRFLSSNPTYTYKFDELVPEIEEVLNKKINFVDTLLPYICIKISDFFVVKIIFSIDNQPAFVVVHAASEEDQSPFEQSEFRVYRTLAVYFSRALADFILKYKHRGIIEFCIWLSSYENLYTTPCCKCNRFIDRDLTGDLLPPIIRAVGTCYAYHIKCAPFEIELPDFGYVTLMSEKQIQERPAPK